MYDHNYLLNAIELVLSWDLPETAIVSAAIAQANLTATRYFD